MIIFSSIFCFFLWFIGFLFNLLFCRLDGIYVYIVVFVFIVLKIMLMVMLILSIDYVINGNSYSGFCDRNLCCYSFIYIRRFNFYKFIIIVDLLNKVNMYLYVIFFYYDRNS